MKKLVMAAFILLIAYSSGAQTDTTKVEQYCQVIAKPRLLSNKEPLTLISGMKNIFGMIQEFGLKWGN